MRGGFDFSSWQAVLSTLLGLALFSLVVVGIRLLVMHTVQLRRERENRQINERLRTLAAKIQTSLIIFQSNHEGALVDTLQKHIDEVAGAIINPAGLTQYSVSLHDCIKAMPFPVIECHLSNLATREEWRHHSIISSAVKGTVQGLGWRSYTAALRTLVEMVREKKQS